MKILTSHIPEVIYKYRNCDLEFHKDLIRKQEIYLANPYSFNDPFDCKIPTRWDLQSQQEINEKNKNQIKILKKINPSLSRKQALRCLHKKDILLTKEKLVKPGKEYFDKIDKISGVISFTTKPDNVLMWSHYSNSHKGFVIGFNTQKLLEHDFDFFAKVNYVESFPLIQAKHTLEERYAIEMFS